MFDHGTDYPLAVTSQDDDGIKAGISWCFGHMNDGDHVTVWTSLKSNLRHNQLLEWLVTRYSKVDHVTARGGAYMQRPGPVLMAWANPNDISEFIEHNSRNIRALCVISWDKVKLIPWVSVARPELLGDASTWTIPTPKLDPVVIEEMEYLTNTINHNNTIAAVGYDKDYVVSVLLGLHDAGYELNGPLLAAWAIANGWAGKNPAKLEEYVKKINQGTRPRIQRDLSPEYVEQLKSRSTLRGEN